MWRKKGTWIIKIVTLSCFFVHGIVYCTFHAEKVNECHFVSRETETKNKVLVFNCNQVFSFKSSFKSSFFFFLLLLLCTSTLSTIILYVGLCFFGRITVEKFLEKPHHTNCPFFNYMVWCSVSWCKWWHRVF